MYRSLFILVTLSFATASIASALSYTIAGLGTLGGDSSYGLAINDSGTVVGQSSTADNVMRHAFMYDDVNGMVDIDSSGGIYSMANDVSNTGYIVGTSESAFIYTSSEGMATLGIQGGANSVNDSGQVVGTMRMPDGTVHSFRYDEASGIIDSGTLELFNAGLSYGLSINNHGHYVGRSSTNGTFQGFIYDENGMNTLDMQDSSESFALGINNFDQISGMYRTQSGSYHVFISDKENGMTDIGSLDDNRQYVSPLNSRGQLVGYTFPFGWSFSDSSRPFIYDPVFGFKNLNELLNDDSWTIYTAYDINSSGQIVGTGSYGGGDRQAFVMSPNSESKPIPEPSTILLLSCGVAGLAIFRRKKR